MIELLQDNQKIREEREKAKQLREKLGQFASSSGNYSTSGIGSASTGSYSTSGIGSASEGRKPAESFESRQTKYSDDPSNAAAPPSYDSKKEKDASKPKKFDIKIKAPGDSKQVVAPAIVAESAPPAVAEDVFCLAVSNDFFGLEASPPPSVPNFVSAFPPTTNFSQQPPPFAAFSNVPQGSTSVPGPVALQPNLVSGFGTYGSQPHIQPQSMSQVSPNVLVSTAPPPAPGNSSGFGDFQQVTSSVRVSNPTAGSSLVSSLVDLGGLSLNEKNKAPTAASGHDPKSKSKADDSFRGLDGFATKTGAAALGPQQVCVPPPQ